MLEAKLRKRKRANVVEDSDDENDDGDDDDDAGGDDQQRDVDLTGLELLAHISLATASPKPKSTSKPASHSKGRKYLSKQSVTS